MPTSSTRLNSFQILGTVGVALRLRWLALAALFVSGMALSQNPLGVTNLCVGGAPNAIYQPGEECDTGSSGPLEGCDSNCRIVDGWACANPVAIGPITTESYPGANAIWSLAGNGRTATQTANTATPTFGMVGAPAFAATYTFEAGVITTSDDDFFGFALGFEPGETQFGAATDYLVLSWKQATQLGTPRGLALLHVVGATPQGSNDASPFWTYGSAPQPPVSVLAWANSRGDVGWSDNVLYDWEIEYTADRLVVTVEGVEEFNLQASSWPDRFPNGFPDGRLAFYSFNQEQTRFTITGPYEPSSCALALPGPPIIGTATAGNANATVAFMPPAESGGSPISLYTATSYPGGLTGTCTDSPCTVSGLNNGSTYTFTVFASNSSGDGPESAHSNDVTPMLPNYVIGGDVLGLTGSGLVLQNLGADDLAVNGNGPFTFDTALPDGSAYDVSVLAQPIEPSQTCDVVSGAGVLNGADVTDIEVICVTDTYEVTPQAGVGGSMDPDTPQTVVHGETTSFEVAADPGYSVGTVVGCGGALNGSTFLTGPVTADCTVVASFVPGTSSTLESSSNPVRAGESVSFTVVVTGVGEAPDDGQVTVSSGAMSCTDAGPPVVAGPTSTFNCAITFATPGPRGVEAVFTGSSTHTDSSASPLTLSVMRYADLAVTADDGASTADPGNTAAYLVEVRNTGPDDAPGTRVQVAVDPAMMDAEWTCEPAGTASCPETAGNGPIDQTASLPVGGGLDYILSGTLVDVLPPTVLLVAQVQADAESPSFVFDPQPGNNAATDVNVVPTIFTDGFE